MSDLVITGVIDGPLSGGVPKAVELYVRNDIADLSVYGLGSANNGGGTDGEEFTFPADAATAGSFIYVASETIGFTNFMGFAPTYTSNAMAINGDDAIELFQNGTVVDLFGDQNIDGTGEPWDHLDGWAYRNANTGPSATFDAADWTFSGTNALDGEVSNATADTPFPAGSYSAAPQPTVINAVLGNTTGTDSEFIELYGAPGASLDGLSVIIVESDSGASNGTIDARIDLTAGDVIGANGFFLLANGQAEATYVVTADKSLANNFVENSSYTVALVETASLTGTTVAGTEVVLDAVGVTDGGAADSFFFGAPVVGPDGSFLPAGVRRIADGVDTDTAADFTILDFGNDPAINNPTAGGEETPPPPPPSGGVTLISAIQGTTDTSPLVGQTVTVEAVVVGDFQDGDADTKRDLRGFYLQEQDADADGDAATSEGIFVFDPSTLADVNVGDVVRVTGTVAEFFGETQIGNLTSVTVVSQAAPLPTAATITLPATGTTLSQDGDVQPDLEQYEGMLVSFADTLTVAEMFQLDRFNEIKLVQGDRPAQFTQTDAPDAAGYQAHLQEVGARTITYDDGLSAQNASINNLDGFAPFSDGSAVSMGDTIDNLTGVLGYQWAGNGASGATWRVRSTVDGENTFDDTNPRDAAPNDVGSDYTVAAFNVLNFFTTLDVSGNPGSGPGALEPRGADNQEEYDRQLDKLVTALLSIDADVFGLIEIENEFVDQNGDGVFAIDSLVDALNTELGSITYDYVQPGTPFVGGDAIAVGFIYNVTTTALVGDAAILDTEAFLDPNDPTDANSIARNRAAVAQTFEELSSGETFTASVNHFKSKGASGLAAGTSDPDSDQGDGQGFWNDTRTKAAIELSDWLATDPTGSGDDDILILGDLNAYAMEDPIVALQAAGYTNLAETFEPGGNSFVFDGQVGTLDYAMANAALAAQVTGTTKWNINSDEADALDYNLDFGRDPAMFDSSTPFRSSDHDPVIVGLDLATPVAPQVFTLELLHITDQEAATGQIGDIARASGILNALEEQDLGNDGIADNTVRLSSGDAVIPGTFYDASAAVFGAGGIADIQIVNEMGFHAVALGNHEFDKGTAELARLIDGSAPGDFKFDVTPEEAATLTPEELALIAERKALFAGTDLEDADFTGTAFPYLSTNLDFSTDANLAPLAVGGGQAPQGNVVSSSTVLDVNGEKLGVVGAVTPNLGSISSIGGVGVSPAWGSGTPTDAELDALAAEIQAEVDALLLANPDMNKVVLLAHMQQIDIEYQLATRLSHVDIIVAGGSNTRLFDDTDYIRPGDSDQGDYPQFFTDADGNPIAVVNTDGSYKYVGRLVIDFDADGKIIPGSYDPTVSGAYATDATGLANVAGAAGLIDPEIQAITDAIEGQIIATESNVFGISNVFLNGNRAGSDTDGVRTQETNLGNLTADANLAAAQAIDNSVLVSIKNGGGIRASIGETVVPAGGGAFERLPNGEIVDSDGNVVKPEGGISQNDIAKALSFNNSLTLLTLTHQELVDVLEHGIGSSPIANGKFPQVSGLQFSFDDDQPEGSRLVNAAITDADGTDIAVFMRDGVVQDPTATVRIVTLGFLANGGDAYPFPTGPATNRVDLVDLDGDGAADGSLTGVATFAADGTEQDAMAEYLAANFGDAANAYDVADSAVGLDNRIQNLDFRTDGVIDAPLFNLVEGTDGRDRLSGTDSLETPDIIISKAGTDTMEGGLGADVFVFGLETMDNVRDRDTITDYEVGVDVIGLAHGATVAEIRTTSSAVVVYFDGPARAQDALYVRGEGVTADNLTFETFDMIAYA